MTNREALLKAMAPKSDQLNADDLLTCTKTILITKVVVKLTGEQKTVVSYEGDEGRPWKPSKGMMRLVSAFYTDDPDAWVGRSVTLYRNASVTYGAEEVGGIWVSHVEGIEKPQTVMITVKRGKKVKHTVYPLVHHQPALSQADHDLMLKTIAQSIKNAALRGSEALAAYWNTVTTDYRNDKMVAFYNAQAAVAVEVDNQRAIAAHKAAGVVPVSESTPNYTDDDIPAARDEREQSGIENF
jgi:hypothetical protein